MGRALLTSLVLVLVGGLSACSVNVEGATCTKVGATDECPSGQACGTGKTCSVRAASCVPCVADGVPRCRIGSDDVSECSAAGDPACGIWKVVSLCQVGLQTCKIPKAGGVPECACASVTVVPGAVAAPCTRPSITSAIAEAARFSNAKVRLAGTAPAAYGNELDDAAPIIVPEGVTLAGDETTPVPVPAGQVVEVRGAAPAGLVVEAGASVSGLTVRRFDAGAPAVGVLVDGPSPALGNSLAWVQIDAGGSGGAFATGLRIAGANAVSVSDVLVKGATVAGLEVNRLGATDVVLVDGSVFDGNQVGVSLLRGDLTLGGTTVKRSVAEGVVAATGNPGQTSLAIANGLISWNGRGGVRLSVNDALSVTGTRICGNTGYPRSYSGVTRPVGGIFTVGNPPTTLTFRGNLVHDNGGDQVYVGASSAPWDLSGATGCAATDRNEFANYTSPGVGVAAVGAVVSAIFNSWGQAFPVSGSDYFANPTAPLGSVDAGTGSGATDFCGAALPGDLVCPSP